MTNPGVIQQQDHRTINDAIDDALVQAVLCRSEYVVLKQFKYGNERDISVRFYHWFGVLVALTSNHKTMRNEENSTVTTRAKFILDENPKGRDMDESIRVFDEYRLKLELGGVVTITK